MPIFCGSPAPCRGSRVRFIITICFATAVTFSHAAIDDLLRDIPNPVPETNSKFGYSVDGYDGNILVGAPLQDIETNTDAGIAYRFGLGGNLVYPLFNPLPNNGDEYGFSVDGFGKFALVGAPFDSVVGASSGGAVHLHRGSDGLALRSIGFAKPLNNSGFGWSVYTLKS